MMLKTDAPNHLSVLHQGTVFLTDILQRSLGHPAGGAGGDDLLDLSGFMAALEPRIGGLFQLMKREYPIPGELAQTSFAAKPSLGGMRFRLVEFFTALLHMCPIGIHKQLLELRFVPTVIAFVFEFPLHNFLHSVAHDLVVRLLSRESEIMDEFVEQLLGEAKFTERIIEAFRQNEADVQSAFGTRRGYMGHLTLLANRLVVFSEADDLPESMRGTIFVAILDF